VKKSATRRIQNKNEKCNMKKKNRKIRNETRRRKI